MSSTWKPTEHPFFPLPTKREGLKLVEKHGQGTLLRWLEDRETKIKRSTKDPFLYGIRLPHWKQAKTLLSEYSRLLAAGGNRSAKTQFAACHIAEEMAQRENFEVAVFSMTSQSSVRDQQPAVYNWLPSEWKSLKKSKSTNITFSRKNGFSDNVFITPNGSRCTFYHYSQQADILEGCELDLVWFDELVPYTWVDTAAYRLVTRAGKMLITATPITGWTPVVSDFMAGMKVIESKPASLLDPDRIHVRGCKPGHMPYVAECLRKDSAVVFFRTEDNPFQPISEMERVLKGETDAQKKCRAYGYVEKSQAGFFPRFNKTHVIAHDRIPNKNVTRYMCVDPAGSRMWFGLWLAVGANGDHYIYREFPDSDTYGNWAELGEKPEGVIGEAAKAQGWGRDDYKSKFMELENGEQISERLIDPRAGGTPAQTEDGSETLLELLEHDPDPLYFIQASGIHIDQGIDRINSLLTYDPDEPISVVNKPILYISDRCQNLIRSMQNLTPAGGDKNKWKDPVDVLRYLAVHGCEFINENRTPARSGAY
jgi:hypothetical protein